MALRFNLIRKIFSTGRGEWIIFIFSLLLAFFMWSIQRFSQEYSTYLNYHVTIESPLIGRVQSSTSNNLLLVKGKCSGFYVLKKYLSYGDDENIKLELNSNQLYTKDASSNIFYAKSSQISSKIQDAIGQDFECEDFVTDTLFFNIPLQTYKKVPVAVNKIFSYMPQYMPINNVSLKPDSVTIYGEAALINRVDSVYTELITHKGISNDISGVVELKSIKGVDIQEKKVYYSQVVERYVESSVMLPLSIVNLPANINMSVVPSMVKLRFRERLNSDNRVAAQDFIVAVDYNKIESTGGGAKVKVYRAPKEILGLSIEPLFVESIVLNR